MMRWPVGESIPLVESELTSAGSPGTSTRRLLQQHHARLHARAVQAVPRGSLIIIEYEYDDRGGAAGAWRAEE